MVVGQQRMKETAESPDSNISPSVPPATTTTATRSRLAMLKRSSAKSKGTAAIGTNGNNDPFRFQGPGIDFKSKLIGVRDVTEARGDVMCAEAMRLTKAAAKAAGGHKQRIILNISIEGIRISDEKNTTVLYNFPVSRISFIARDTSDARAFGFIFGGASASEQYKFYGIKTAQTADHAVLSIRDMFQVVFEMKKKQIEAVKQQQEHQENEQTNALNEKIENGVAVADLLDLESELHNIEQGVNQLQNIPIIEGDTWPGEFSHSWSHPQSETVATALSPDPFGDSFNPLSLSAPSAGGPLAMNCSASWTNFNCTNQMPSLTNGSQSCNFSTTNPFAQSGVFNINASSLSDPFDSSATSTKPFAVPSPNTFAPNGYSSAPVLIPLNGTHHLPTTNGNHSQSPSVNGHKSNWTEPNKKVTSLEEAFSKLVDMNALVSSPGAKKNPFHDLINPPKVPLKTLSGNGGGGAPGLSPPPAIPTRTNGHSHHQHQIVYPGNKSDPFNDDFFN